MIKSYIDFANAELKEKQFVTFPEELFINTSVQEASEIVSNLDPNALMLLPKKEIAFFEWLKVADFKVWQDLWDDDSMPEYVVSISFLPLLVYQSNFNGFPICDLMYNDNYYFTIGMMDADHSQTVLEAAKARFEQNLRLDLHQILALEIAFNSIDIWHFANKYHVPLQDAKLALEILIQDKAIKHYKKAEEVAKFIQF